MRQPCLSSDGLPNLAVRTTRPRRQREAAGTVVVGCTAAGTLPVAGTAKVRYSSGRVRIAPGTGSVRSGTGYHMGFESTPGIVPGTEAAGFAASAGCCSDTAADIDFGEGDDVLEEHQFPPFPPRGNPDPAAVFRVPPS